MRTYRPNPIVSLVSRLVSPFIVMFALYVIFHGHYSPGGGFQGGTLIAAALILIRLSEGNEAAQLQFPRSWGTPLGSLGVLIYFGTGLATVLMGGRFLDYSVLHLSHHVSMSRSYGILMVEIGVGLAVTAILVSIFDNLLEGNPDV